MDFCLRRRQTHPNISDRALKLLMPFTTSYLCEKALSSIKNKYRMRSKLKPDFDKLCSSKQSKSKTQNSILKINSFFLFL